MPPPHHAPLGLPFSRPASLCGGSVRDLDLYRDTVDDKLLCKLVAYRKTSGALCESRVTSTAKRAARAVVDAFSAAKSQAATPWHTLP